MPNLPATLEATLDQLQRMLDELRILVRRRVPGKAPRGQTLPEPFDDLEHAKASADTLEKCKVCGVGFVAPIEMERWSRDEKITHG